MCSGTVCHYFSCGSQADLTDVGDWEHLMVRTINGTAVSADYRELQRGVAVDANAQIRITEGLSARGESLAVNKSVHHGS